jgi:hypothetical protein
MNLTLYQKIFCLCGYFLIASICFSQKREWDLSINSSAAVSWAKVSGDIKTNGGGFAFDFSVSAEKSFKTSFAYYYIGASFIQIAGKLKNISTEHISFKSEDFGLNSGQSAKYSIQYLTIPIGIKLKTRQYGRFFYYCQSGLLPGIKINGSIVVDRDKHPLSKDLNLMTCAVQLSTGLLYPTSKDTFVKVGIIFDHFFTDIFSSSNMNVLPFVAGLHAGFVF